MLAKLLLIALAATGAWISMACGPDRSEPSPTAAPEGGVLENISPTEPSPTAAPEGVVLESISPISGTLGAEVVLRGSGFTSENNDVAFTHPEISFQGRNVGYLTGLSSPDGNTLRFNLPDNEGVLLGACAFSRLGPNEACRSIGILLPSGDIEVSVVNHAGESGSVTFTVLEAK